jgi:hypothetical protein
MVTSLVNSSEVFTANVRTRFRSTSTGCTYLSALWSADILWQSASRHFIPGINELLVKLSAQVKTSTMDGAYNDEVSDVAGVGLWRQTPDDGVSYIVTASQETGSMSIPACWHPN